MTEAQAKKLGSLLAKARATKGLSLRGLAEETGLHYVTIQRIEQGDYRDPAADSISRLAEALDIDPARVDRVSGNYLAESLPTVRTYFRSKEKASPEEIAEIETALRRIRAKHERGRS